MPRTKQTKEMSEQRRRERHEEMVTLWNNQAPGLDFVKVDDSVIVALRI